MDTPAISVTSCGHPLDCSVTSCGHPPGVSVSLIVRILKIKLKMRMKMTFLTIFTMLIVFLRVYVIFVKINQYMTVPLSKMVKLGGEGGQFHSLREAYTFNLFLLQSLETIEKCLVPLSSRGNVKCSGKGGEGGRLA